MFKFWTAARRQLAPSAALFSGEKVVVEGYREFLDAALRLELIRFFAQQALYQCPACRRPAVERIAAVLRAVQRRTRPLAVALQKSPHQLVDRLDVCFVEQAVDRIEDMAGNLSDRQAVRCQPPSGSL